VSELKLITDSEPHRLDVFAAWLPRIGVAVFFIVFAGWGKFSSDPRGDWVKIFNQIGLGQWFRYFTGVMQVTGGILLLVPATIDVGAAMLASTMVGAVFVQAVVLHHPGYAILPAILLGAVVAAWWAARARSF